MKGDFVELIYLVIVVAWVWGVTNMLLEHRRMRKEVEAMSETVHKLQLIHSWATTDSDYLIDALKDVHVSEMPDSLIRLLEVNNERDGKRVLAYWFRHYEQKTGKKGLALVEEVDKELARRSQIISVCLPDKAPLSARAFGVEGEIDGEN